MPPYLDFEDVANLIRLGRDGKCVGDVVWLCLSLGMMHSAGVERPFERIRDEEMLIDTQESYNYVHT